ncbi:MAG: flagellar hook-associated protein FlgL [Clostridia bacterium]|jgi:flagellar hook-associated protein 3 FlgL
MRVTNSMLTRHFLRNLDNNLKQLDHIQMQMATGRKFFRPSDDPVGSARSLQIRRSIARIEQYQRNAQDANAWLRETETVLMQVKDIIQNASELTIQGANGALSDNDRKAVAVAIRGLQEQLVLAGNSSFAGRYIFGGSNTQTPPFSVENGVLYYNGRELNTVDTAVLEELDALSKERVIYDLGAGLQQDADTGVTKGINVAFPGSNLMGYGQDPDGLPNSLYSILEDIAVIYETSNDASDQIQPYIGKLQEKLEGVLTQLTDIGERTKFLDFMEGRLEDAYLNYVTRQSEIEDVDQARAIIDFSMKEAVYRSALAIGARIIQPTLVDFLR